MNNRKAYHELIAIWEKIGKDLFLDVKSCPFCGGTLSEIREHNGKKYRHCYSCHFEFEEEE